MHFSRLRTHLSPTELKSFGRGACSWIYLDSLDVGKVVQLLGGPGQRPVGEVSRGAAALQDGLGRGRGAPVEQLPRDHGRHRGLGGVGGCPAELFGVVSLIGSHGLCNLRDHGKNASRKLLMAEIRHPELIFFITWEERGAHCRHAQAPKAILEKNNSFQITFDILTNL